MTGPILRTDHLLTPEEHECLDYLIQEASEVIQAASKIKCFGRGAVGEDGTPYDNVRDLGREVGDMRMIVTIALRLGLVEARNLVEGDLRKSRKLKTHARFIGNLL